MSLVLQSSGGGQITVQEPATASNFTQTLPAASGTVVLAGTTPTFNGITFPATQVPSADANTLDDYEEGTWTPVIRFGGGTTGVTYSFQNGLYTKIGNLVFIRCTIVLSSKGSSTGNATVTGLPFTSKNTTGGTGFALTFIDAMASITGQIINEVEANSTTSVCFQTSATTSPALTNSNFTNTSNYQFSGCYQV
jgi:hypothetical protein